MTMIENLAAQQLDYAVAVLSTSFVQPVDQRELRSHLNTWANEQRDATIQKVAEVFTASDLHMLKANELVPKIHAVELELTPAIVQTGADHLINILFIDGSFSVGEAPHQKTMAETDLSNWAHALVAGTQRRFEVAAAFSPEYQLCIPVIRDLDEAKVEQELTTRLIRSLSSQMQASYQKNFSSEELAQVQELRRSALGTKLEELQRDLRHELQMRAIEWITSEQLRAGA